MATVNILADIADTLTVLAAELKKVSAQGGFEKFAVETPFEEVKPEPVQAAPAEKKIGYDDLRKLCAGVSAAGKTAEQKNFERLETLWESISECHSDWQLHLHHDTRDMVAAYQEGSIFVMTSRYEGFPLVLIEAMACGLPCVAFDCATGPKEIIEDGKTGYLIPYNDDKMFIEKLTYLMQHPEVRRSMGEEARRSVRKFSAESVMKKWKEFYERLANN